MTIRIQPEGKVQEMGCEMIAVGATEVAVSVGMMIWVGISKVKVTVAIVAVGVGKLNGNVGGICVGVAGGGKLSAKERKMPPKTKITETIAMMIPAPSWRRDCMITPPRS
jgi:hypothetical protein